MSYFISSLSFIICITLTPVIRLIARKNNWMAYPEQERWHKKPTAKFGGIAMFISIMIPLCFIADFTTIIPNILQNNSNTVSLPSIATIICICLPLIFAIGLVDDFINIKPQTKLIGQILIASIVTFFKFRLQWFDSLTLDTVITIIWIVGITNAFNLIDNMDGLCAGVGFIACLSIAILTHNIFSETANVALIFAGAFVAFLLYNFKPASIFMGDCGSLMIGFTLSMLCINYSGLYAANAISSIFIPILILFVPIFDTVLVTLIRLLSGRKASVGGKDHTSHRLVIAGLNEKSAVLFLYGISIISACCALFVYQNDTPTSLAVIIPITLFTILGGIYIAQLRVYPEKEFGLLRNKNFTPLLVEIAYKKQLLLVGLDFCLITFSYYLSYRLRFDSSTFPIYFPLFLQSLPAVIACKFTAFFIMGIYRGIWQYISTNDIIVYLKASFFSTILSIVAVTYIFRFENFSKGIFVIDWFLLTGFILGTRAAFRLVIDNINMNTLKGDAVFIYGANGNGEIILREIMNNKNHNFKPVGFIDDNPLKTGKKFHGYTVVGTAKDLDLIIKKHHINGLMISNNTLSAKEINPLKDFCRKNKLYLKEFVICFEDINVDNQ